MEYVLSHHGILGQKWGVRKGPPYPISPGDHSAAEKKAGWRKSLDNSGTTVDNKGRVRIVRSEAASGKKAVENGTNSGKATQEAKNSKSKSASGDDVSGANAKPRKGLTSGQKKAIAIGVTAAAIGLATYGAYKLGYLDKPLAYGKDKAGELLEKLGGKTIQSGAKQAVGDAAQNAAKQAAHNAVHQTAQGAVKKAKSVIRDPKTGFRMINETLDESLRNANPLRKEGVHNNCTVCTVAGFLRTLGLEATAKSTNNEGQNLGGILEECFKGVKVFDGSARTFAQSPAAATEMLKKRFGDNAAGAVSIMWRGSGDGHAFSWQIVNGVVKFLDFQTGEQGADVTSTWPLIDPNGSLQFARLDGLEINLDNIDRYVDGR